MKKQSSKLIASAMCVFMIQACGDSTLMITDSENENESALLDGIRTLERPEIGAMYRTYAGFQGWHPGCTVTLVEPNVIVTARHCVDWTTCEADSCMFNNKISFTDASGRDHDYRMDRFVSFDRAGRVAQGGGRRQIDISEQRQGHSLSYDVAVARLSTSVPASVATPAPLLRAHPANGTRMTAWGYGCQNRTTNAGDWTKQLRDFVMGQQSNRLCPGDSGGPMTQGRTGGVVYVNSGYIPGEDIFGDVVRFRGQIDTILAGWTAGGTQPPTQPPSNGGGCEYVCESQNTRVKYCGGVEIERKSVCGATQECVSLSPTQTTCRAKSEVPETPETPETPPNNGGGCEYECEGPNTRVKYCGGVEVERKSVCGATQECVSLSPTRTTCEAKSSGGGGGGNSTPSGCYYQCDGEGTRVHFCDGAEIGRQAICGPNQACVNTSSTTVTCQNR